jgi:ATP-dependent Lon protease
MSSIVQAVSDSSPQITSGETEPFKLPMMPIRDMVVYPGLTTPFVVGRELSLGALEYALANDGKIFLATQYDASNEEPKVLDISQFGCVCKVLQNIKMANGNVKVLVVGTEMAKTLDVNERGGLFIATLKRVNTQVGMG